MDTVIALLRASKLRLALAILAGAASGLSIAGLIGLINTALGLPRSEWGSLAPAFAALCLVVFAARTASQALLVRLSQQVIAVLRRELARQILAAPLARLEQHGSHRLLAALTDDVNKIAALLTRLPTFCINSAVLIGSLAYLGWLSPWLLLAAITFIVAGVLGFNLVQNRAQTALTASRQAGDELVKHFIAVVDGTKELQLHQGRREAFLNRLLDPTVTRVATHHTRGMTLYALAESGGMVIFFLFLGLLLFLPPSLTTQDLVVISGYALTFLYLLTPLEVLVNTAPDFGQFRVALKRIGALQLTLADHAANRAVTAGTTGSPALQSLELRAVTHHYRREHDDSPFQLGPIDLSFRPGELVFITGGNGSGKTTLAKLILGLYHPDGGTVYVNGEPVDASGAARYRQLFSAVFADFHLFDQLLGLDQAELEARAHELLVQLKLEHKVRLQDGAFSTTALSTGQRKRLALLAAVLEDRPIYLFDEWAADQDPLFRRVFYTEILPWLKARGKTVLAITHDDAYFHLADRHIRLEFGQLVADAPAASLHPSPLRPPMEAVA